MAVVRRGVPFELFFPIPSLSTTSSLHLMRRFSDCEGSTFALGVDVDVDVSSPRSRRVCGNPNPNPGVAEDSRDVSVSVVDASCGVVSGRRDRDILFDSSALLDVGWLDGLRELGLRQNFWRLDLMMRLISSPPLAAGLSRVMNYRTE